MLRLIRSLFQKPSENSLEEVWTPPEHQEPAVRLAAAAEIIEEWILRTGLTKGRREDIDFYLTAYHRDQLFGDRMRKIGTPMSVERKRELGLNTRAVFTKEFWETLSDAARANPLEAAWKISGPVNNRISNRRSIDGAASHGRLALFMASPMAAGPCAWAKLMDQRAVDPATARIPPVDECPHPEQCACMYRAKMKDA